jgi:hypothetical protein
MLVAAVEDRAVDLVEVPPLPPGDLARGRVHHDDALGPVDQEQAVAGVLVKRVQDFRIDSGLDQSTRRHRHLSTPAWQRGT